MSADNVVRRTSDHLKALILGSNLVGGRVFTVHSPEDMKSKTKPLPSSGVGILYEGIRPTSDAQKGVSAEMVFSLLVLTEAHLAGPGVDPKNQAIDLLDSLRGLLLATRSPTQHFWRFVVEAPATEIGGSLLWLQRWSTSVQLTNRSS